MAKEFIPTDEQLAAIEETNRTLLVSAAAGSGKTAALTERILRSVCRKDNPISIRKMLVVTFTRSAAKELSERISAALTAALEKNPGNKLLSDQLLLLPSARISTIHSYCNDLIRRNADKLHLPARIRIADEAECAILARSVMAEVLEEGYLGRLPIDGTTLPAEEFSALADNLSALWQEKDLEEYLMALSDALSGYPDGDTLLAARGDEMQRASTVFESRAGAYIKEHTHAMLRDVREKCASLAPLFENPTGTDVTYGAILTDDLARIDHALSLTDYASLRLEILGNIKGKRMPSYPVSKRSDAAMRFCAVRSYFTECLKKEVAFYQYKDEQFIELLHTVGKYHKALAAVVGAFKARFGEEKRARGVCDYNDLEHMAYRLLYRKDGSLTDVALAEREEFDQVYIDEYQDVNAIQHKIFEAISHDRARFMVGDIKQSIYGFRGARPDIFADLRRSMPTLDKAGDGKEASVYFTKNFRSDDVIIHFANGIFRFLFGATKDSIGYRSEDDLTLAKKNGEGGYPPPSIAIFPGDKGKRDDDGEDTSDDEEITSAKEAELAYVAKRIRALCHGGKRKDGTPIKYGDIAILLRSRTRLGAISDKLAEFGIPVCCEEDRSFFLNPEVLLALSLLNTVNNPHRDIYLAAVLLSPIYGFTLDELLPIKSECPAPTLYESIVAYSTRHPENEKLRSFLSALGRYRTVAEGMPADKLLRLLYDDTALLSLAGKGGTKRDNLLLLYNYARSFEASSFRGLYRFIHYINEIIAENRSFDKPDRETNEDAVRIMTVHASKGLQFPIVFLCDASSGFRAKADTKPILHPDLGLGMYVRDDSGYVLVNNPLREAIRAKRSDAEKEEEMRILYVAITRAEEQLYISGTSQAKAETILARTELLRDFPSREGVLRAGGWLGWLLAGREKGTYKEPESCDGFLFDGPFAAWEDQEEEKADEIAPVSAPPTEEGLTDRTSHIDALTEEYRRRFDFVYPHAEKTRLPGKLSVSRLYPDMLDTEEGIVDLSPRTETLLPRFLGGNDEDEGAKRGTATHLLLQFADLDRLMKNGAKNETEELTRRGFFPEESASLVNLEEVDVFASSPYPRFMKEADKLYRELRFHIELPAEALTKDPARKRALAGESVLVQGVIDCLYIKDGHITLIDYKTDRIPDDERNAVAAAKRTLILRHRRQLAYYAAAVKHIFGKIPDQTLIYSLALGDAIPVDVTNYLHIIEETVPNEG